ncbi:cilia- and flagella-associated protein 100 isoform X2 [Brienomyrus brachyistius]|uniref:cilia- and flagella-associated protein 100 isoform X2 n=1 Tax=Brienomyrus brachyistius TaxID=42636 RepID=UPI0020B228AF|nr:cilia- and flagella-associated protein 100 isoform X2 [Brienomyrus brachyistius]
MEQPERNPFRLPSDSDIFLLLNQEKQQKMTEREQRRSQKVHEKLTYTGRMNAQRALLRRALRVGEDEDGELAAGAGEEALELRDNAVGKLAMLKDRNIEKESIREFISKKREMILLEYSLAVKQEEMEKLEKAATAEERKLAHASKLLEEDALMFDSFLQEINRNSAEAIKIAEQETKVKLERISEIKKITAKVTSLKSDISKYNETLEEYRTYKRFLKKLVPAEWLEKQRGLSEKRREAQSAEEDREKKSGRSDKVSVTRRELPPLREARTPSRHRLKSSSPKNQGETLMTSKTEDADSSDCEEDPVLYFTNPEQLLDLLNELEEQNLSLIQNSRETEEALEEYAQIMEATRQKMEQEKEQLTQQIDAMTRNIELEKERAAEMELKVQLFSFGNVKAEDQDTLLESLTSKVEEVYRSCVGDSEANLSPLAMLTTIEGRLCELLESTELIPRERVLIAERAKEKERRLRLREDKLQQKQRHQEECMRRAMERSQAATGRKLMFRSQPPAFKTKESTVAEVTDKEKEEYLYFFTMS